MIGSPFIGCSPNAGTYPSKGSIDASLAANLPANPFIGDTYIISVAGDFEDSALLSPQSYQLTVGDSIVWDGTDWLVRESGDDSLKTSLDLSDLANATTARTNLGLGSMAVEGKTITTLGDLLVGGAAGALARLPVGSNTQVLTVTAGAPAWAAAGGTVADIDALRSSIAYLTLDNMLLTGAVVKQYDQQAQDLFVDETGVTTKTDMNYSPVNNAYRPSGEYNLLVQSASESDSGGNDDGSTTLFTDATVTHTLTAKGNVRHSITQAKFGTSSIYFDGTGDYISVPDSSDFDFGAGDFTIQLWIRPDNVSGGKSLVSQWGSSLGWSLRMAGANLDFYWSTNGSGFANAVSSGVSLTNTEWHHVAVVRDGNTGRFFINGSAAGTFDLTGITFFNPAVILEIGTVLTGTTAPYAGYMEDIAITKGIAVYTSAFTPPTDPLSNLVSNITFVSDPFTATVAPTQADVYALVAFITGSVSDLSIGARRDGSSSYVSSAPTDTGHNFFDIDTSLTYDILKVNDLDLSGQTSGLAPQVQLTSSNNINFTFKGWLMQWL